jgi:uncharacterized linocin/CFP29 family protein
MDLLKRGISPLTDEAWAEIDSRAKEILTANLTARKFVNVLGPKGWDYGAVPIGRLDIKEKKNTGEMCYGIHTFQPLIETRIDFDMEIWELDNINRGAKDIDLEPLEDAAKKSALFEEAAIYKGLEKAGITGLSNGSSHDVIKFDKGDGEKLAVAISKAITVLKESSVPSPYTMVANPSIWHTIMAYAKGYPLSRHINELLENGEIIYSPTAEGAYIIPTNNEDLEMTIGQDFCVGFERREEETVKLFIAESFTFRILDPDLIVRVMEK